MRETWTFHSAGQLIFGRNAVRQLGDVVTRLKARRALLVTDTILLKAGLAETVQPAREAGVTVEVFSGGEPEPSVRAANACIDAARALPARSRDRPGGGSNMDLAKITAAVLTHGAAPLDYTGDDKLPGPVLPLICLPTTAGTGSEVSAASVLTDSDNHIKVGVLSNYLRPRVAIVDPLLTVSCPPKVTADSGIDALTHAIEAYTAVDNEHFPTAGRTLGVPGASSVRRHARGEGNRVDRPLPTRAARRQGSEAREGMALGRRWPGCRSRTSALRWFTPWSTRRRRDALFARPATAAAPYVMFQPVGRGRSSSPRWATAR
jgi:alcohol dehydrogenase class IV